MNIWIWNRRFVIAIFIWSVSISVPSLAHASHQLSAAADDAQQVTDESGLGQTILCDSGTETRLQFETALQALAGGEAYLAIGVLKKLAVSFADETPDRQVIDAIVASAEGHTSVSEDAVLKILAKSSVEDFTYSWIYEELVRRGAEIRLAQMKVHATAELEALLTKHYEARGGLTRLQALTDLAATGRMVISGQEIPFRLYRKRPQLYRLDLVFPTGIRTTACDGEIAWQFDAANGNGTAKFFSDEQAEDMLRQAWFDDVLIRFRSTGENVYLAGISNLDSADAHRIEVGLPDGGRHSIFLDTESFLEIRRIIWSESTASPVVITYEYGVVDGLQLPVHQTVTTETTTVEYLFDEHEIQKEINPEFFDAAKANPMED